MSDVACPYCGRPGVDTGSINVVKQPIYHCTHGAGPAGNFYTEESRLRILAEIAQKEADTRNKRALAKEKRDIKKRQEYDSNPAQKDKGYGALYD